MSEAPGATRAGRTRDHLRALAGTLVVGGLCLLPLPAPPRPAAVSDLWQLLARLPLDKLAHAALFCALAALSLRSVARLQPRWALLATAGLVVSYGALLEWLQGRTGYRDADPADLLANCAGVLAFLAWKGVMRK